MSSLRRSRCSFACCALASSSSFSSCLLVRAASFSCHGFRVSHKILEFTQTKLSSARYQSFHILLDHISNLEVVEFVVFAQLLYNGCLPDTWWTQHTYSDWLEKWGGECKREEKMENGRVFNKALKMRPMLTHQEVPRLFILLDYLWQLLH